MVKTIEQALQSLSMASFIFGFGIFKYPVGHPRVRLSIFYILTLWSVYVYVFHKVINYFSPRSIFDSALNVFITVINMFVTTISIITTFSKYKVYFFLNIYIIIFYISIILKTKQITYTNYQFKIIFVVT